MKRIYSFIALAAIVAAASCNNGADKSTSSTTTTTTTTTTDKIPDASTTPSATPPQPEGLALMAKTDCNTCHNMDAKIVGPSYKAIAAKYPNNAANVSKLSASIIKGEVGAWGTVPMPAHGAVTQADADKMSGYILSLGDNK